MKNISKIQKQIKSSLADCCSALGFDVSKSPTFYNYQNDIVRIIHIDFLNAKNAAYFNSNTASFTLNLGIFFDLEDQKNLYPREYEAQIRGVLIRDFRQKHPMDLKGFSLFHPERRRRDIWWVEKNGSNLDDLVANASRIITKNAIKWLDKYSDMEYVVKYFKNKNYVIEYLREIKEREVWKVIPIALGSLGSPGRQNLINRLENKIRITSQSSGLFPPQNSVGKSR